MRILNLTQHPATPEQVAAGVFDLTGEDHAELVRALTFETLPSLGDVGRAARDIVEIAISAAGPGAVDGVMVGGAPWLMAPLSLELAKASFKVLYAFSVRESVEITQPDGSVRKTAVFRHGGFVG